jgi:hypothetical protein
MSTSRKLLPACGAAIAVVALVAAYIAIQGPTRASGSSTAVASKANALKIGIREPPGANAVGQPAAWIPHDVMVRYRNLPRAYGCDALWYKVGDILRAAGAWRAVSITPYACQPSAGSDGRSPRLEVRFLTLRALAPAQARWSQTRAVRKTVTLEPGTPRSLSAGDCALLVQTEEDVLSQVPTIRVVHRNLPCGTARTATRYSLALQMLEPVRSHIREVRRTAAALKGDGSRRGQA